MAQSNGHVRNWQEADAYLGAKQERPIAHNTRIRRRDDGAIVIRLHETDIITYYPREAVNPPCVTLRTGGWLTPTTKERINTYIPEGFRVWQNRGQWTLYKFTGAEGRESAEFPWAEGITIDESGEVFNAGTLGEVEANKRLQRQIAKYVRGYVDAFIAGEVPAPSNGDCWICLGVLREGDTEHILTHFEESYYVPTLLVRAIESYPVCMFARNEIAGRWSGSPEYTPSKWGDDILRRDLTSSLRRYLRHVLGIAS